MSRRAILAVSVLVAAVAVLLALRADDPTQVKALRYRILWADSALELSHGGGRWVDELYIPSHKMACTLVPGHGAGDRPRLYVSEADRPRNDLTGIRDPKPSPIEEVEVPRDFVARAKKLLDLTLRRERAMDRLGGDAVSAGFLRVLPQPPDFR